MKFYIKVWEEVSKIKSGEFLTYSQIAEKIGHPKAHRAVGNALHKNPFPVVIPCHRVIKKDGSIGGFLYGDKKIKMLESEGIKIKNRKVVIDV